MGRKYDTKYPIVDILKLITGICLAVIGVAAAIKTNTDIESLPLFVLGLSTIFGLVAGIADEIELLQRVFRRGYWLIAGIAIIFLITVDIDESTGPLVIGFSLAFSSGVLISTIAVLIAKTIR